MWNEKNKWDHDRERAKYAASKEKPDANNDPAPPQRWKAKGWIEGCAFVGGVLYLGTYIQKYGQDVGTWPPDARQVLCVLVALFLGYGVWDLYQRYGRKRETPPSAPAPAPQQPAPSKPVLGLRDDEFVP